jgi:hypothetical protein
MHELRRPSSRAMVVSRLAFLVCLGGVQLWASSCRQVDYRDRSEAVLTKWTKAFQKNDFEEALSLYSREFFETTSPEKWKIALMKVHDELGDLESIKVLKARTTSSLGLTGSHVRTELNCEAKFANGSARMSLVVVPNGHGNEAQILTHVIHRMN